MARPKRRAFGIGPATLVTITLLIVVWAPIGVSGSASDPEIADASGDVFPGAYAANDPDHYGLFQNLTAYDVVKAWVGVETQDAFLVFVQVKDLPDGWGMPNDPSQIQPSRAVFGNNATYNGTTLWANFTIGASWYQAVFKIFMPEPGVMALDYSLWAQNGSTLAVPGGFDTLADRVWAMVPKALIPGLADGTHLAKFWVLGRYGDFSMDYAPDAKDVQSGSTNPLDVINQLVGGQQSDPGTFVQPQFAARDYVFGQYNHGGGGGGGGGSIADLAFNVVGDAQKVVVAGHSVSYELRITNNALEADEVTFTVSAPAPGWAQQLSLTEAELGPQDSRTLYLTVSAAPDAEAPLQTLVQASSTLGGAKSVVLYTIETQPAVEQSEEPDGSAGPTSAKGGSPALEFLATAALLGALVWIRRRD